MADLLRDTFIRANQSGWGTASDSVAWSNANGNSSIVSNYGAISGTNATSTPTNYRSLSRQNNLRFIHKLNLGAAIESGGVLFGGVKNTGSGNRDGVEWYIFNGTTNNLGIYDNGTMKGQANFTFTTGTDYWVEMIVNTDYSCELRVWLTSDSRPTSATVSCTAFTPGSSGTNFQFGYSDNGNTNTHKFSDLTVSDLSVDYPLTASQGSFTLTGYAAAFYRAYSLAAAYGSFVLTGIAATLTHSIGYVMSAATGLFTLTGSVAALLINGGRTFWTNASKNATSFSNQTKNTTSFSNESKNTSIWTNQDKTLQ